MSTTAELAEIKAEVFRIGQFFPTPTQEAERYASESRGDALLGQSARIEEDAEGDS